MSADIGFEFSVAGGSLELLLFEATTEAMALFDGEEFRLVSMVVRKDGLSYRALVRAVLVPRSLLLDEGIELIDVEPEFRFPWFRRRKGERATSPPDGAPPDPPPSRR